MADDFFSSAATLARRIRAREVSAEELLEGYLDRVDAYNPSINAIVVLDIEEARRAAKAADDAVASDGPLGPLHGVPMTIKESFNLAGTPTTYGLLPFRDNVAVTDAVAVSRLKAAGAVIFGKTNVPPGLADAQSANEIYGRTRNPWNLDRTPGGSSGGSAAALAAGLSALELGSDIASSLRNPAHYCGVFAHKPTYGLCSSAGHSLRTRHAAGDISVIGPLARSAEDLETEFRILADASHERFPGQYRRAEERKIDSFRGLKIGVILNDDYAEVDSAIERQLSRLAEFLRGEGADVRVGWRPGLDSQRVHEVYELLMRAAISQDMTDADIAAFEIEKSDLAGPKSQLRTMFLQGVTMSHREWLRLNEERHAIAASWRGFFEECDILLCPVLATTAFPHDERAPAWRTLTVNGRDVPFGRQLFWAGYTGAFFLPSTVAPVGFSDDGLPIGVQIVGDQLDDILCIRFARLMEERYHAFVPPPAYAAPVGAPS
ncbi:amidase [Aquibium sp. LZ166]|uniref:Amidase n=1 Tax=Aquibium pacificus TaxID=3153579 RepID=A0ABV3SJE1_9HYPH